MLEVLANRIERMHNVVFSYQKRTIDQSGVSQGKYYSFKSISRTNRIKIARMNTSAKQVDFMKVKEPMLHLLSIDLYLNKRLCIRPAEHERSYSSFEGKGF